MKWLAFVLFIPIIALQPKQKKLPLSPIAYTVSYDFTYLIDTVESIYSAPSPYTLMRCGDSSRFEHEYVSFNDSIHENYMLNKVKAKTKRGRQKNINRYMKEVGGNNKRHKDDIRVRKDFVKNEYSIILYNSIKRRHLAEPFITDWDITDRTDTINNTLCYIAATSHGGREYTAWFAPDIPISDGPYVFSRLPGLILKVVDSDNRYQWVCTDIEYDTERYLRPTFHEKRFVVQIDRPTYVKKTKEEQENPKLGPGMSFTAEERARFKKRYITRLDLLIEKIGKNKH